MMANDKHKNEFIYVDCAICGANNFIVLFTGHDYWYETEGDFILCQCQKCGLIYQNPQPKQEVIGAYYPKEYAPFTPAPKENPSRIQRFNIQHLIKKQIKLIHQFIQPPGKALDIGCATGNFLAGLRKHQWEVCGIELDNQAAEYARTTYNLTIQTGLIEDLKLESNSFDLVTMWHVLEHVHSPSTTINEVTRITKPGGYFFFAIPNIDSWDTKLFKQYWAGWDLPRHLWFFDRANLKQVLKEDDWEIVTMETRFGRHWLFNLSIAHFLNFKLGDHQKLKRWILKLTGSILVRGLLMPYFIVAESLKKGPILVIVARRRLINL